MGDGCIGYSAKDRQRERLEERREEKVVEVAVCGLKFKVSRGVYQTAGDTELMAKSVEIDDSQNFLEVGCGCGAVSIILARKAREGLGVDINAAAVENSKLNAEVHDAKNVSFVLSNLFEEVREKYDVVLFNPPYNSYNAEDEIDMMFWDSQNKSKVNFFKEVRNYLKSKGKVYFGWADFDDLDKGLPLRLAKDAGFVLKETYSHRVEGKAYTFIVYEFS